MTPPPDPSSIDWTSISLWASGAATVLGSVGAAVWLGVQRAIKIAGEQKPAAAEIHRTDVYTTDSVAMERLTGAIAALNELTSEGNRLMLEGNALKREATDERRSLRQALDGNTAATERSLAELGELRDDVRELTREMVRLQAGLAGRRGA